MAITGARKAALLLTALDSGTAAELLKSARPETITEIAAELAFIRQGGPEVQNTWAEPMREFFGLVHNSRKKDRRSDFVKEVLEGAIGKSKSQEVLGHIADLVEARDPFLRIRSAAVEEIAAVLAGESSQVAALVLTELPASKSAQLLSMLDEAIRSDTIRNMTVGLEVPLEAKLKVATVIRNRLDQRNQKTTSTGEVVAVAPVATPVKRDDQLRKVSLLLRGLEMSFRDSLLAAITQQDAPTGESVKKLMVIWEDVPLVGDRSLQEVLRSVDARSLALSLVKTTNVITKKIRSNVSERAVAMLDEETSLLSNPKTEDIEKARETLLDALRELNAKGQLPLESK